MKLLLDNIIFHLQKIGGISIYWKELLKRAISDSEVELQFISENREVDNYIYKELLSEVPELLNIPTIKSWINHRYLPLIPMKLQSNVIFHSSYYRALWNNKAKKVLTVHDFIYEHFDHGLKKSVHSFQKAVALLNADIVICISENTKQDLITLYPKFSEKDIRIIYNGVSNGYFPIKENKLDKQNVRPYLLVVGNRVGCKNFGATMDAYINYLATDYDLIIVGKPLNEDERRTLKECLNQIKIMTGVSEDELNRLYNDAHALIFPSTYEGFGIPIIEAMKAGCPVITTKESCIKEVAGDGGVYMDSLDAKGIIDAVKRINNPQYRKERINSGLIHSSQFSWDKTYEKVKNIYRELYYG